ncbi:MAG TPA: hypothetical protein VHY35_12670 [Stellaceae bacterium]|jgi:hypothetical protein|nr:hypothetical protein [Stellaceae bacterium]
MSDPFALGGRPPSLATPALGLSFVFDRAPDDPDDKRRCFWCVTPTGDYGVDCDTGERYAREYITYEQRDDWSGGHLQLIVGDMPREFSGIEIGFLATISEVVRRSALRPCVPPVRIEQPSVTRMVYRED